MTSDDFTVVALSGGVDRVAPELALVFSGADLEEGTFTVRMIIGGQLYENLTAEVTSATNVKVKGFASTVNKSDLTGAITSIEGLKTVNGKAAIADGTVTLP